MAVWKSCPESGLAHRGAALFLDRDGVVVADRNYLSDPREVEILPGVVETLRSARADGYLLIGVSNQSGLGRGRFTEEDLNRVMARMDQLLAAEGVGFDGFYYCPHAPDEGCDCRKPALGLFTEAARSCRWDRTRSWVVGDKTSDVAFGRDGGLGAVLVRTGHGSRYEAEVRKIWADDPRVLVADDLAAAWAAIRLAAGKDAGL